MKIEIEMENKTKENASIERMNLFFFSTPTFFIYFSGKVCLPRMIDGLIDW